MQEHEESAEEIDTGEEAESTEAESTEAESTEAEEPRTQKIPRSIPASVQAHIEEHFRDEAHTGKIWKLPDPNSDS